MNDREKNNQAYDVFHQAEQQRSDWREWYHNQYLKSDHWIATRSAILKRDGHQCRFCGCMNDLSVHHITYDRLGCESETDLITLCSSCHSRLHDVINANSKAMEMLNQQWEKDVRCAISEISDKYFDLIVGHLHRTASRFVVECEGYKHKPAIVSTIKEMMNYNAGRRLHNFSWFNDERSLYHEAIRGLPKKGSEKP